MRENEAFAVYANIDQRVKKEHCKCVLAGHNVYIFYVRCALCPKRENKLIALTIDSL